MTQKLIDKSAVVMEIKKIYNEDYKFLPSDLVEGVQDFKDDLLIALDTLEVKETDDAYKQGYNDAIDKACDAYCRLCDTKECGDTSECEWVEKFRKRLMRQQ